MLPAPMGELRVLEVMETVGSGGAEMRNLQVFRTLARRYAPPLSLKVMSFEAGPLEPEYRRSPFALEIFEERGRWAPWNFWRFRKRVADFRPHLVHVHGFKSLVYAVVACQGCRFPLMLTWHGYRALDTRRDMQWVLRHVHRRLRRVEAVSPAVADLLVEKGGIPRHKILVHPNVIDTEPYRHLVPAYERPRSPEDPLVIGMVGRLAEVKNYPLFLHLVQRLAQEFPRLEAWIVGDGPLRPELEALTRSLGIADRVRFWGFRQDIPRLLARMDLFVFTSHAESFGLVVAEAQAAGLPVVVSDYPAAKFLVKPGETGYLARRGDLEDFLDKTRRLLKSAELRRRLGRAARRHALERYSLEAYVARLYRLYQQLVAQP